MRRIVITVCVAALLGLALVTVPSLEAQEAGTGASPITSLKKLSQAERSQAIELLPPRYKAWLSGVVGLISQAEFDYFLGLRQDFRRDAFMEAFWKPRDPNPRTVENELYERWREMGGGSGNGVSFTDPRLRLYLFNGPPGGWNLPDGRPAARCFSRQRQLEIWFYERSERLDRRFPVILLRRSLEQPYVAFLPGESVRAVQHTERMPTTDIRLLCAEDLLRYAFNEIERLGDYDELLKAALAPPLPPLEWLATFSGSDAEPPEGADLFDVGLDIEFPSRNQSRTTLQVMLTVPRDVAPGQVFDGVRFHHFLLIGEVIKDGQRLESFRYRFEGPTPETTASGKDSSQLPIPLGFTRFLRSGEVQLRLLLHDVFADRYAHRVIEFDVPSAEGLPASPVAVIERPSGPSLTLLEPPGRLHTGPMRFRARPSGDFDKVSFFLDGEVKLSKRKPPFSVELDLGNEPKPHIVRVVGFLNDVEIATDQIWLNQGPQRFRVGLVEPRTGGIYPGGFIARIDVTTPDGRPAERLELYLGDTLLTTLTEGPFAHAVRLANSEPVVVRAVAYLDDGSQVEDAVLVNSSPLGETVEVRLVELPAVVTDRDGQPITGLGIDDFRLLVRQRGEDLPQALDSVIPGSDLALSSALLIDRSASMQGHLRTVTAAAGSFAAAALVGDDDRLAVYSFADRLRVDAALTPQLGSVERALAGLVPAGATALYDSLVEAIQSLQDAPGPSVLVLFTDGQDEASRLTFEQARDALRSSGISLYSIATAAAFPAKKDRQELQSLAEDSGGRAVFLDQLDDLTATFAAIADELRGRYLLTFQPSAGLGDGVDSPYLELRLEVEADGATVRTRPGFVP